MTTERESLKGRVLHGTFVVDDPIGEGGMGMVYAGHNARTPAIRYAIKVLRGDGTAASPVRPEEAKRFRREAQALASLDHPSIVRPIHADVTAEGAPYLVMELVRGVALRAKLDEARASGMPLPLPFVLAVLDGLADALDHAHGRGIIHRDLKPENVLVIESGRSVVVKVLDFGIAKIFHPDGSPADTLTRTSQIVGTLSYMSPEQCRNLREAAAPSDRFSLGILAYELLTGLRPFDASNPATLVCNILLNPMPPVTRDRADLPPAVDVVMARACDKEPAARFPDAASFVTALAEAVGHVLPTATSLTSVPGTPRAGQGSDAAAATRAATVPLPDAPAKRVDPARMPTVLRTETVDEPRETAPSEPSPAPASVSPPARASTTTARGIPRGMGVGVAALIVAGAAIAGGAAVMKYGPRRAPSAPRQITHASHAPAARPPSACPGEARDPTPGLRDDEVCMPGGAVTLGGESPRVMQLRGFFIDRYEVTVARYRRCVSAGGCDTRGLESEAPVNDALVHQVRGARARPSPRCTFRAGPDPASDALPVNCLNAEQAEQLCRFEGRRLPSEAEWERAASGLDGARRQYPWGDDAPSCARASYGDCARGNVATGASAASDATPEGVLDLAGNVAEWTSDEPVGTIPELVSPRGEPSSCERGCRVVRGGSWATSRDDVAALRGTARVSTTATRRAAFVGVRCVRAR